MSGPTEKDKNDNTGRDFEHLINQMVGREEPEEEKAETEEKEEQ